MSTRGVIYFVLFVAVNCKIPDYIPVCSQNDKDLASCITNSINSLKPRLLSGIPDLGVPALEPLVLDSLRILGETSISTNLSDVKAWGVSEFKILKLIPKITKNTRQFRFEVNIPKLHVKGNYAINTRLAFIDLKGSGPFNANISSPLFECALLGKKVQQNGENHLKFQDVQCIIKSIGKSRIYFENLFNGDPIIGKAVNDAIDDNSEALFAEARPNIVEAVTKKLLEVGNKITESFTFEELFP